MAVHLSSCSSSTTVQHLAGIAPVSTAATSTWYRGGSFCDGYMTTITLAPKPFSPANVMLPFLCSPAPARLRQACGSPVCAPEYFVSGFIRVFLVPHCGHDTVRAVERDRTCLCEAGARVGPCTTR